MNSKNTKLLSLIVTSLFAALVFIFTYIHIDIPTPLGKTMLHLGNVMCMLAGYILGGVRGGLAAGFGSMFYDLFDPAFLPECWITFIMKFTMALAAGCIANARWTKPLGFFRYIFAGIAGGATYLALYMTKTFVVERYVKGYELQTVFATMLTKGTVSAINQAIAAVASILLFTAISPALKKADPNNHLGLRLYDKHSAD